LLGASTMSKPRRGGTVADGLQPVRIVPSLVHNHIINDRSINALGGVDRMAAIKRFVTIEAYE
jgi:hypothetical protein